MILDLPMIQQASPRTILEQAFRGVSTGWNIVETTIPVLALLQIKQLGFDVASGPYHKGLATIQYKGPAPNFPELLQLVRSRARALCRARDPYVNKLITSFRSRYYELQTLLSTPPVDSDKCARLQRDQRLILSDLGMMLLPDNFLLTVQTPSLFLLHTAPLLGLYLLNRYDHASYQSNQAIVS